VLTEPQHRRGPGQAPGAKVLGAGTRLSTIRNADTIVVMEDGRIVEQGDHDDLLQRHGAYNDLYTSQFTEAPEER